ncbi:hypothetical protein HYT26_00955 [Candidatus Pacearchaeota archaeon]|nr:hypothetical protein [Candidatus Pacearchaeota archaeon]
MKRIPRIMEGAPLSVVLNCTEGTAYLAFVLEKSGVRRLFRVGACRRSGLSLLTEMCALINSKIHYRYNYFSSRKEKEIRCALIKCKDPIFRVKVDGIQVECEVNSLVEINKDSRKQIL